MVGLQKFYSKYRTNAYAIHKKNIPEHYRAKMVRE
jgi:hypothetical protein